jgi:hypothetical protein
MTGNMAKGICGSLAGTLNWSWSASMEGAMTKMIAMVVASEMYG